MRHNGTAGSSEWRLKSPSNGRVVRAWPGTRTFLFAGYDTSARSAAAAAKLAKCGHSETVLHCQMPASDGRISVSSEPLCAVPEEEGANDGWPKGAKP